MNKTFWWNGQKFPFSAMEAETMRNFVNETNNTSEALVDYEKSAGLDGSIDADGIIEECKIIDGFFNKILGEGTAEKIFKGYDLSERVAAFKKLARLRDRQVKEFNDSVHAGLFE